MTIKRTAATLLAAVWLFLPASMLSSAAEPTDLPLVYENSFEKGAECWQPTDASAWRILELEDGNHVYNQFGQSKYKPPHRSPYNISLLQGEKVGDFVLTTKVLSTDPKSGAHRDMCVFFGYQDPAHFYYVHLGARPDPHSSQIMIVNDAPRVMITDEPKHAGVPWTDDWHTVKVVRKVKDGTIAIYFDDMEKPIMTANDTTFGPGLIGLGSFDNHGYWDELKLYGDAKKAESK